MVCRSFIGEYSWAMHLHKSEDGRTGQGKKMGIQLQLVLLKALELK